MQAIITHRQSTLLSRYTRPLYEISRRRIYSRIQHIELHDSSPVQTDHRHGKHILPINPHTITPLPKNRSDRGDTFLLLTIFLTIRPIINIPHPPTSLLFLLHPPSRSLFPCISCTNSPVRLRAAPSASSRYRSCLSRSKT